MIKRLPYGICTAVLMASTAWSAPTKSTDASLNRDRVRNIHAPRSRGRQTVDPSETGILNAKIHRLATAATTTSSSVNHPNVLGSGADPDILVGVNYFAGWWKEQHPSYLRVGGCPVFKIHGGGAFLAQTGGTAEGADRFLTTLRTAARDAGLGELIIGVGGGGPGRLPKNHWMVGRFDYTNEYMAVPHIERTDDDHPFETLDQHLADWRAGHQADPMPAVPFLSAGWNPRPWQDDQRPCFRFPTRTQWRDALQRMKVDLATGVFGFPRPEGGVQPAFTIYAWNEFGEGGIMAPTKGDGYMKLEGLREVFEPARKALGKAVNTKPGDR